jgi:hypothetical protein
MKCASRAKLWEMRCVLLPQNAEIELMFSHKHLLTIIYPKKKQTSIRVIAMSTAVVVIKARFSD